MEGKYSLQLEPLAPLAPTSHKETVYTYTYNCDVSLKRTLTVDAICVAHNDLRRALSRFPGPLARFSQGVRRHLSFERRIRGPRCTQLESRWGRRVPSLVKTYMQRYMPRQITPRTPTFLL
jgi:hypothetical protein